MKTKHNKVGNELGCGFMERIFNLKSPRLRNSLVHSLPIKNESNLSPKKVKRISNITSLTKNPKRISDTTPRSSTSSSSTGSSTHKRVEQTNNTNDDVKFQIESTQNSLQLARISTIRPRNTENKSVGAKDFAPLKLTGNLLVNNTPRRKSVECLPKHSDLNSMSSFYNSNNARKMVMGNIMRKNSNELAQFLSQRHNSMEPEVLKSMGNEAYKKGDFVEALALYDKAISFDSNKAIYHCNKSAALIGLGRFQEAILECEESIRLDPSYNRAHNRLATIYFRLGEVEKALDCSRSTSCVDSVLAFQAQALQNHINKCIEARKFNEWSVVLKETQSALSLGADSAPRIYAFQTEALLKLLRYEEANAVHDKMPKFPLDWCNNMFGMATSAYILMIGAQVYLASGRFEDAVTTAQKAARVDPSNREMISVLRRARAVTSARVSGNLLFKASKFSEACAVYNEGLDHDPHNSVLLCNRAACRSKLAQYENAIEDCDSALTLHPSYSKARLRRAYCNAKLERWEVAIQDYEMLIREKPGDEEVARALFEAKLQVRILHGEDVKDLKFGWNLVFISSNDRFRHYVTSPGMAVVLFSNKGTHKQVSTVFEQISKRFPSVNFLKVEIEDHPYLAKSEGVSSFPTFKIYKNGSRVKEISGNNHELLERSVKLYSS
ncbi:unnamed protein product [Lathyrus sativus]|nr:unnamed protein product [Lathyrus sativus]